MAHKKPHAAADDGVVHTNTRSSEAAVLQTCSISQIHCWRRNICILLRRPLVYVLLHLYICVCVYLSTLEFHLMCVCFRCVLLHTQQRTGTRRSRKKMSFCDYETTSGGGGGIGGHCATKKEAIGAWIAANDASLCLNPGSSIRFVFTIVTHTLSIVV